MAKQHGEQKPIDAADELKAVRAELEDLRAEKAELLAVAEDTYKALWHLALRTPVGGGTKRTVIQPLQQQLKKHLGRSRCEQLDIEMARG